MDDLKLTDSPPQGVTPQPSVPQTDPMVGEQTIPKTTPPAPAPATPPTTKPEKPPEAPPSATPPQIITTQTITNKTPGEKPKLSGRFPKSPRKKIIAVALIIFMIVLGGISIGTAWKLRQVEKVIPEEAEAFVGARCSSGCVMTVGPGKFGFEATGHGTNAINGPGAVKTASVAIPDGTTVHSAYIFWSGEAYRPNENDSNIVVNGVSVDANPAFSWLNTRPPRPERRYYQYANLAQIPKNAIKQTTGNITFNVKGFDPLQKDFENDIWKVHNHGFGVVVVYTGPEVRNNKIIVRLWGEWLYLACPPFDTRAVCEGPRSKIMEMKLLGLDTTKPRANKFAFFFGEGERYRGICQDEVGNMRPSHLYYQTTGDWKKLAAKTGVNQQPWPACPLPESSQPGGWWATRISGDNLDPIVLDSEQIKFNADSTYEGDGPPHQGDSYTFVGVAAQYPVAEPTPTPTPTPPLGCWETCTPGTCPQEPQDLECQDVGGLRCVNPACPSEENCECPPLLCLDLIATPSAEFFEGDEVEFTCVGSYNQDHPVDYAEFRVLVDDQQEGDIERVDATATNGEYQAILNYTIPKSGGYRIECRVCTSIDDSQCTQWGEAE